MPRNRKLIYLTIGLLIVWAVIVEPRWVAVRNIRAHLPQQTAPLHLKIAIVSDWHFTQQAFWRVMTPKRAQAMVAQINAAKPDVILILGDLIAEEAQNTTLAATVEDEIATVLGQLKAPKGIYAVLGNHDWWYDGTKMQAALQKQGITVLENQALPIPHTPLWLAGIGDETTQHANPIKTFSQLPNDAPTIVMMHDPASFAHVPAHQNALFFAGHTHGGQVYLHWVGALVVPGPAPRSWAYGWLQHHQNWLYITSGLGVSILPVRFNMRPEWVLLNI